jgi:hypothetical protein
MGVAIKTESSLHITTASVLSNEYSDWTLVVHRNEIIPLPRTKGKVSKVHDKIRLVFLSLTSRTIHSVIYTYTEHAK